MIAIVGRCLALVCALAGCGRVGFSTGTSVELAVNAISQVTIKDLDAHIAFVGVDPGRLYAAGR